MKELRGGKNKRKKNKETRREEKEMRGSRIMEQEVGKGARNKGRRI